MPKTVRLQAIRPLTYATRRLVAGDPFDASERDARLLLATRKVRRLREPATVPAPPRQVAEKIDLAVLRAEYERRMGKRPYHGWDADELRRRIDDA
jgi:hypothetical protein